MSDRENGIGQSVIDIMSFDIFTFCNSSFDKITLPLCTFKYCSLGLTYYNTTWVDQMSVKC
jgi:hypothetical protein